MTDSGDTESNEVMIQNIQRHLHPPHVMMNQNVKHNLQTLKQIHHRYPLNHHTLIQIHRRAGLVMNHNGWNW